MIHVHDIFENTNTRPRLIRIKMLRTQQPAKHLRIIRQAH